MVTKSNRLVKYLRTFGGGCFIYGGSHNWPSRKIQRRSQLALAKFIHSGRHFVYGGSQDCLFLKIDLWKWSLKLTYGGRPFNRSASENGGHFRRQTSWEVRLKKYTLRTSKARIQSFYQAYIYDT
jgi:hypothetical protein